MRVRIYLDGLNFYYGIAKAYNCKWIDLCLLFTTVLNEKWHGQEFEIEKLFLFSSEVIGAEERNRQTQYFSALKQHDHRVETCMGVFQKSKKTGKILTGPETGELIKVSVREEKQTDVNLACQIVDDAHTHRQSAERSYDTVCVVTNDGDITPALKVLQRLEQNAIIIFPRKCNSSPRERNSAASPSKALKQATEKDKRIYEISEDVVKRCLLPRQVGEFCPPSAPGWYGPKPR